MVQGKDIANFLTNKLGRDFNSLYELSKDEENKQAEIQESIKRNFKDFLVRLDKKV